MKKSIFIGALLGMILMWGSIAFSSEITTDDVAGGVERGKGMVKEIPVNPNITEAEKEAFKVMERHNSDEYQRRIESEMNRIQRYFETGKWDNPEQKGKPVANGDYYTRPSGTERWRTNLAGDERIYILISSSVPMQTLRNYGFSMERAKEPGIKIVLRGFVKEEGLKGMKATKHFVRRFLTGTDGKCLPTEGCEMLRIPAGIQIDPLIFRRFNVKDNVPAIVYVRGASIVGAPGKSEGSEQNMQLKESYIVHGDVSLEYAIELFQRNLAAKGMKSPGLEKLLAAVGGQGGF